MLDYPIDSMESAAAEKTLNESQATWTIAQVNIITFHTHVFWDGLRFPSGFIMQTTLN